MGDNLWNVHDSADIDKDDEDDDYNYANNADDDNKEDDGADGDDDDDDCSKSHQERDAGFLDGGIGPLSPARTISQELTLLQTNNDDDDDDDVSNFWNKYLSRSFRYF